MGEANTGWFGQEQSKTTTVAVFHDERYVADWLYHGLLVIERGAWPKVVKQLDAARSAARCDRPVHYKELNSRSTGSSRTRLAVRWAQGFDADYLDTMRFFLLGVDLAKLDHGRFGDQESTKSERKMRVYNRFFEMVLYTALRWFFTDYDEVEVSRILSETRSLAPTDPFLTHAPAKISRRDSNVRIRTDHVEMLDAKTTADTPHPQLRDALQIVDVLTGGWSQLLDDSSNKRGCCEVAGALASCFRKVVEDPHNPRRSHYKRLAARFFPRTAVDSSTVISTPDPGQMYHHRSLTYLNRDQLTLYD